MTIPAFTFATAGRILFGRGRATEAPGLVAGWGQRVVVVHGRDGARAHWLIEALRAAGLAVETAACPTEPDLPLLRAALARLRPHRAEAVVGIGGGAAIDLAKALAALLPAAADPMDHLEVVGRALPLPAPPLPMLALPTTAGTGAEVTKNAVIGVPDAARKVSLRDDRMLPRVALVDPALTDGLPWAVTRAAGLDAFTQVVEPFLSARATPLTDALTRAAGPLALPAMRRLAQGEDPGARDAMAYVSLTGGLALANAGLGAVHGLAGVIGGRTGAAHGAICGALLPHVLLALDRSGAVAERMAEVRAWIAKGLGTPPDAALPALAAWVRDTGLPGLAQMGVTAATLPEIAAEARLSSSMKGSAVAFDDADLQAMLAAAL